MAKTDSYYIERCLDGHVDDFRYLVRRYQAMVLAHLLGRLGNKSNAEEAAQEAFVRAYFGLEKLKKPDSFCSWLLGIAGRVAKEHQRAQRHRCQLETAGSSRQQPSNRELSGDFELEQAVAQLPATYRELILLRYYGGVSCRQIAEQLNMPLGTVTKTLSRAYALLRESLVKRKDEI